MLTDQSQAQRWFRGGRETGASSMKNARHAPCLIRQAVEALEDRDARRCSARSTRRCSWAPAPDLSRWPTSTATAEPDLAVANSESDNLSIFLGDGLGISTRPRARRSRSARPLSVAVGDFNRDGQSPDLAMANFSGNVLFCSVTDQGVRASAAGSPVAAGMAPDSIAAATSTATAGPTSPWE